MIETKTNEASNIDLSSNVSALVTETFKIRETKRETIIGEYIDYDNNNKELKLKLNVFSDNRLCDYLKEAISKRDITFKIMLEYEK